MNDSRAILKVKTEINTFVQNFSKKKNQASRTHISSLQYSKNLPKLLMSPRLRKKKKLPQVKKKKKENKICSVHVIKVATRRKMPNDSVTTPSDRASTVSSMIYVMVYAVDRVGERSLQSVVVFF